MPYLEHLSQNGFSIWPFDSLQGPAALEIYPRVLTGPVNKSRWHDRHAYLHDRYADQSATMLERAAGSEDAFDAAVSALVMARDPQEFSQLDALADRWHAIEGRVWAPNPSAQRP